jgi:F-type H+-transporting ATPase subunit delta
VSSNQPIIEGAAGRYATALFELARDEKALDTVAAELKGFVGMLDGSPELQRMVASPVFSAEEQERVLAAILARADMSGLTQNVLRLLARNRRLFLVRDVIKGFNGLLARHRGEASAEVVSAHPLDEAQLQALRETLRNISGREVRVETHVDPSILGGLVVKIGSRMIDSSLKTKLTSLKHVMKEVR